MSASVNRAWLKQQINVRRRERLGVPEHDPRLHGTVHTYKNLGCRCDECRAATREAKRRWRQKQFAAARNVDRTSDLWVRARAVCATDAEADVVVRDYYRRRAAA